MRHVAKRALTAGRGAQLLAACWLPLALALSAGAGAEAVQFDLKGPLGVATAEYIIDGINEANAAEADIIVIRTDTPGGLVDPTRDIIQAILGSEVPVATFVAPGGARAASAGTYILLASHIAAMAPTTSIGAATPVSLSGDDAGGDGGFGPPPETDNSDNSNESADSDDAGNAGENDADTEAREPAPAGTAMNRKVLNDAVAYIRSLADRYDRNADWAESAVRDAATLTDSEALEQNVIDVVADNVDDLLQKIDGREVTVAGQAVTLATGGLAVRVVEPDWRLKFLGAIANPQVALLLLLVGIYGLLFEGYNPGALVPGIVGVVCLLLAAYALQVLPVNYVGLALILVGILLIVAEAFVPSFGALGLGGIVAFIVGGIIMFDSGIPGFGISKIFVVVFGLLSGLALLWLASYLVKLRKRGAVSGTEGMVGRNARAMDSFTGVGHVWMDGEMWQAHSVHPIAKDQDVEVLEVDGLTLIVRPLVTTSTSAAAPQT